MTPRILPSTAAATTAAAGVSVRPATFTLRGASV
jgi:hypothetical protein